jgi:hypothetical protein
MPTLDDAPITPTLVGGENLTLADATDTANVALGDIVQVYDVSEQKPKAITVEELGKALGLI